jgi:hypothetical protein
VRRAKALLLFVEKSQKGINFCLKIDIVVFRRTRKSFEERKENNDDNRAHCYIITVLLGFSFVHFGLSYDFDFSD